MENFDILVCGSSDPGSAALLSPWSTIEGFHFDSTPEEDNFMYEFREDLNSKKWKVEDDSPYDQVRLTPDSKERYFEILNKLSEYNNEIYTFCTESDDHLIIEETEDIDAVEEEKAVSDVTKSDEKDQS